MLQLGTFIITPSDFSRGSYSITVNLAFAVTQQVISGQLPKTSETIYPFIFIASYLTIGIFITIYSLLIATLCSSSTRKRMVTKSMSLERAIDLVVFLITFTCVLTATFAYFIVAWKLNWIWSKIQIRKWNITKRILKCKEKKWFVNNSALSSIDWKIIDSKVNNGSWQFWECTKSAFSEFWSPGRCWFAWLLRLFSSFHVGLSHRQWKWHQLMNFVAGYLLTVQKSIKRICQQWIPQNPCHYLWFFIQPDFCISTSSRKGKKNLPNSMYSMFFPII